MSYSDDDDDPTTNVLEGDVGHSGFDDVEQDEPRTSASAFLQEAGDEAPFVHDQSSPPPFSSHDEGEHDGEHHGDSHFYPSAPTRPTATTASVSQQGAKEGPMSSAKKRGYGDDDDDLKRDDRSSKKDTRKQNGQSTGGDASTALFGRQAQARPRQPLQTKVLDPKVVGVGTSDKHVEYQVDTVIEPSLAQVAFDGHTKFSVFRRFSDFYWLRETLEQRYPGFIIPPLPDKTLPVVQDNLSERFFLSRARSLDYFLAHVAAHVVLSRDVAVKDFLIAEQSRFEQVRKPSLTSDTAAPAAVQVVSTATAGIFEKVLDWGQTLGTTLNSTISGAARVGAQRRERDTSDDRFDEAQRYINELEPKVKFVYDTAKQLVEKNQTLSKALHELGLAFTNMGQSEQQPQLSEAITELGNICNGRDGLSILMNLQAEHEQVKFLEPIEDYVRLVSSAKQALTVRTRMALAYEYALGDLTLKRAAREKMAPNDSRIPTAEEDIREAQLRLESAKTDFEMVTDRVLKEVERFKREKSQDFKALILQYVQMQIDHNQAVEMLWRSVLPRLHSVRTPNEHETGAGMDDV